MQCAFIMQDLVAALKEITDAAKRRQVLVEKKQNAGAKKQALLEYRQKLLDLARTGKCPMTRAMTKELAARDAELSRVEKEEDALTQLLAKMGL